MSAILFQADYRGTIAPNASRMWEKVNVEEVEKMIQHLIRIKERYDSDKIIFSISTNECECDRLLYEYIKAIIANVVNRRDFIMGKIFLRNSYLIFGNSRKPRIFPGGHITKFDKLIDYVAELQRIYGDVDWVGYADDIASTTISQILSYELEERLLVPYNVFVPEPTYFEQTDNHIIYNKEKDIVGLNNALNCFLNGPINRLGSTYQKRW